MELHKALKNIIQLDKKEILKDIRIVNMLEDFNAFEHMSAYKYILKAIIVDGYSSKLLSIGKWDNSTETLSNKFSITTGFVPEYVSKVFLSIAYALDWIDELFLNQHIYTQKRKPAASKNCTKKSETSMFPNYTTFKWDKNLTNEKKEEYAFSLIEFDNSKERELGISIENLSIMVDDNEYMTFSFEYVRTKSEAEGSLFYAIYNWENKIIQSSKFFSFFSDDINHKPILDTIYLRVSDISRIRLYLSM